jgi:hypothetical protein
VGPHPGFRVSFRLWLVRMRVPLLVISRGTSLSLASDCLAGHLTLLVVGFECVVLIFMAGRCLT